MDFAEIVLVMRELRLDDQEGSHLCNTYESIGRWLASPVQ